jgi:hypothetical protein
VAFGLRQQGISDSFVRCFALGECKTAHEKETIYRSAEG